ncbi:hypothetical protein CDEST_11819 [Colletotrichum destructivum]|uniref:Uncharacterized protein n=1 Tax=Colletotrichum destructivum TaxID=34406 RepID=A0AAX4IUA5_9PEZI|nr:hypothetical protein CDEST_11819 [Colletotrichum destructivum]
MCCSAANLLTQHSSILEPEPSAWRPDKRIASLSAPRECRGIELAPKTTCAVNHHRKRVCFKAPKLGQGLSARRYQQKLLIYGELFESVLERETAYLDRRSFGLLSVVGAQIEN